MATAPIHTQIRQAREAAGMSQSQLAEALDIANQSVIARYESGDHSPRVDTLQRLADILGATFTIAPGRRRP